MVDELNTPQHRWNQPQYNVALAKTDFSASTIFDSGIQKIDARVAKVVSEYAASLFTAAGSLGFAFFPADWTTLFQDVNGVTPVTATGQSVGLMLDKSQGLALGAELVTNGDFSSATGWTLQTGWSISGGLLVGNVAPAAFTNATTVAIPVAGRTYQVTYTVTAVTSGSVRLLFYGGTVVSGTVRSTVGTFTELLVANSGHSGLGFQGQGAGFVGTIDNISVRELAGNHATQATPANAPVSCIFPSVGVRNRANGSADPANNTYWNASQVSANGITITRVATGLDGSGLPYADYSVVGTATASNVLYPTATSALRIAAAVGQQFTTSFLAQVIGGTAPTGQSGVRSEIVGDTSGFVQNEVFIGTLVSPTSETTLTVTGTLAVAGSVLARPQVGIRTNIGDTVNYTIRIKALQFELGASRTAYQFNYSAQNVTEVPFASIRGLQFDGVDDWMQTAAIDFSNSDEITVVAGVRKLSDADALICELTTSSDTNNGAFTLFANAPAGPGIYQFRSKGTTLVSRNITQASPDSAIVTGVSKISAPSIVMRRNGVAGNVSTATQGTGNFSNAIVYIGRRGGASLPFNGVLTSLVGINRLLSAAELANLERDVNDLTRAY